MKKSVEKWGHDALAKDLASHLETPERMIWTDMQLGAVNFKGAVDGTGETGAILIFHDLLLVCPFRHDANVFFAYAFLGALECAIRLRVGFWVNRLPAVHDGFVD